MTTTVTVKANHGWPVDVYKIEPNSMGEAEEIYMARVPPNQQMDFHCWDGRDLVIHEVQPRELEAEQSIDTE